VAARNGDVDVRNFLSPLHVAARNGDVDVRKGKEGEKEGKKEGKKEG
jgi:hypothetical protein